MSSIAEKARLEADEVEAAEAEAAEAGELDENETTTDDDADTEDAPLSEADLRKAERAIEAQQKKLAGILGEGMVAHECLVCQGLGFVPAVPDAGAFAVVVDADGAAALQWSQPGDPPPFLRVAPDKERCPECDGYGETVTGSRSPHALTAPCGKCSGNGWIIRARDAGLPVLPPSNTSTVSAVANGSSQQVPADAWDRPYGHPHYGIPPSMVGV